MKFHELKCLPKFYEAVVNGWKTFECRKNDRDFYPGDVIRLREWDQYAYTNRECVLRVTYVLRDHEFNGLVEGYAILGIIVI